MFLYLNALAREEMAHQSWPTTKSAQNIVPCANQYSGHAHLHAFSLVEKIGTIQSHERLVDAERKTEHVQGLTMCWQHRLRLLGQQL